MADVATLLIVPTPVDDNVPIVVGTADPALIVVVSARTTVAIPPTT